MSNGIEQSLAERLDLWIQKSGKTPEEIATALGFKSPNAITMMRQGQVKVPIDKIAPLAGVLGCVHPAHFLRLALAEYTPEIWAAILDNLGTRFLSENEQALIDTLRRATENTDPIMVVDDTLTLTVVVSGSE